MRHKPAPDARIAVLATRQHGVVAVAQLHTVGISRSGIARRVRAGRLHPVHRGVYAVGHRALTFDGRAMAAVLALGGWAADRPDQARLVAVSHRSAAQLWKLLVAQGAIDVVVAGRGGRGKRPGVRVHRPTTLPATDVRRVRGIPVTSPARTITDLRPILSARELDRAKRQAAVLGLQLGEEEVNELTRSDLEVRFLRLCERHRLPRPEVNVWVGSREVDFLWRGRRLIVETDGYRYHRGREAFEHDRRRDLELRGLGFEVLRLTYRQVEREPETVARVLRAALGAS